MALFYLEKHEIMQNVIPHRELKQLPSAVIKAVAKQKGVLFWCIYRYEEDAGVSGAS